MKDDKLDGNEIFCAQTTKKQVASLRFFVKILLLFSLDSELECDEMKVDRQVSAARPLSAST